MLKTESRSGKPLELLIERTESGWICHGDAEQVQAEKQRQTVEDKLHPQQKNALDLIREQWRTNQHWSNSKEIAAYLKLDGDSERKARETLDQLCRHGLAANKYLKKKNGRCKIYAPIEASREEVTPLSSKPSELSQLSEPNSQLHRRDRRERSLFPTVEPELIGSSFDLVDPDEDDPYW